MSEQDHWARERGYGRRYNEPSESSRNNNYFNSPPSQPETPGLNTWETMPIFDIAPFSGNGQDAARWIFKLRRAFRAAGIVGDVIFGEALSRKNY
ncbi:hypothetical protein K3495_g10697 [Podosphaera aphanis]|nr:hypothetical protein K3495_g10697 [Podosphaera aphanis]